MKTITRRRALGAAALLAARRKATEKPRLFASSLAEFRKDRQELVPRP